MFRSHRYSLSHRTVLMIARFSAISATTTGWFSGPSICRSFGSIGKELLADDLQAVMQGPCRFMYRICVLRWESLGDMEIIPGLCITHVYDGKVWAKWFRTMI